MSNFKKQCLILLIPYLGYIIVVFLIMFKYFKQFKTINAWIYSLISMFAYLGLIAILRETLLYYPDLEYLQIIVSYFELLIAGFLMLVTQRFIINHKNYFNN